MSSAIVTVLMCGGPRPLYACAGLVLGVVAIFAAAVLFATGVANGTEQTSAAQCSKACQLRVQVKAAHAKWRKDVDAYGPALLKARRQCESGGHGTYRLVTTTGLYWFAYQHNLAAWKGAGGRIRGGRPVGVWTTQPSPLEQDVRAVYWDRRHGGDAWPQCP